MKIWIDADASPNPVKEIVFRAATRRKIQTVLVANQPVRVPRSPFIKAIQVSGGFDEADNYIVANAGAGDIAVTADIPLASELIEKDVRVLTPRGVAQTAENIREKLVMRDFMEEMRGSGLAQGGPRPYSDKDKQAFANGLDRLLAQR